MWPTKLCLLAAMCANVIKSALELSQMFQFQTKFNIKKQIHLFKKHSGFSLMFIHSHIEGPQMSELYTPERRALF